VKQKNLVHICRNSTPSNSFSENEGECSKYFLPWILDSKCFGKNDFCELRKKDDGKIVRSAEKSGKLFCNYRRSSGMILLSNLQKVIGMFIFQNNIKWKIIDEM